MSRVSKVGGFAAAVVASFIFQSAAYAAGYAFTNVADKSTAAPIGLFTDFDPPAISGNIVAFSGTFSGGTGVFTRNGGALTTIAKTGDAAPSGIFDSVGSPAINGGTVVFRGVYAGATQQGLFAGNGGALTTIAKSGDVTPFGVLTTFNNPSLSSSGITAVSSSLSGGGGAMLTVSGGAFTAIAKRGDPGLSSTFDSLQNPSISGSTVAFYAQDTNLNAGIFAGSGGALTTVSKFGDPAPLTSFYDYGPPSMSGNAVAFRGFYHGGVNTQGIFRKSGGVLTSIVNKGDLAPVGTFGSFDNNVSTDGTNVAFLGYYNSVTGFGIFTGSGGSLTPVIQKGDPLFGGTLDGLLFGRTAFDQNGNIAFYYALADGRRGIAVASVPEPAFIALIVALPFLVRRRPNTISF